MSNQLRRPVMKIGSRWFAITLAAALSGPLAWTQTAPTTTKPVVPLQLKPLANAPITIHMIDESKTIYQAIGKLAGLTVLFDPDYISKRVQVDLTNASLDRKSTRLNSSHRCISYAVFCL